jgi:NAD(P)-dependent dehydrogenase (short-subunit alcohol dehydrogenase family)
MGPGQAQGLPLQNARLLMELVGKVAMVTGASSGIGKAVALRFAREGASVAVVARRRERLDALEKEAPGKIHPFAADLSKEFDTQNCVDQVLKNLGGIDILVHAAGIIGTGTIENTTLSQWDQMMNINLRSIFHLTQCCLTSLIGRKGNIVSLSSVAGLRSFPGVLAYSVSKAGLDQFTRCVALELAPKGVRVNAVNPGVVITELHRAGGMDEHQYQAFLERSKTTHPIGRVGKPEEVADLVFYLASDRAGWITGATFSIDGGRALTCAR